MGGEVSATGRKVIAAFDFDGTITTRDTLPVFLWYAGSLPRIITSVAITLPYVVLFKLKIIPNHKAKEKLFGAFFKGVATDKFDTLCKNFVPNIEKLLNPEAVAKIKWHQQMGHDVIIISASGEKWIQPWAAKNGIQTVLGTQFEVIDGKITGRFLTKNCHGPEKVCRLKEYNPDKQSYELYAYGDSNGDKELLAFADHPFYRKFN